MTSSHTSRDVANDAPPILWRPSEELLQRSALAQLMTSVGVRDYASLHSWSVEDVGRFWRQAVVARFNLIYDGSAETSLVHPSMPGARWFPDMRLSYPEHVFRNRQDDEVAIFAAGEVRADERWTWGELRQMTGRVRAGLESMGVTTGDRVVGYLPNIPETVACFLAAASLGAIWSCCSPDLGARAVLERFGQLEPKVLIAVDGYRYGGRSYDRSAVVEEIAEGLPGLAQVVRLGYLSRASGDFDAAFPETDASLSFQRCAFDHPLWVLYSSGTTGLPKGIVHGHGGVLVEHLKTWKLQLDVRDGEHVMWFTTTGWMMWNFLVSALASGAAIVCFDGNPGYPDMGTLWDVASRFGVNVFGTGAAYLHACLKQDLHPAGDRDLSALRAVGSTGSPLSRDGFRWVYAELPGQPWLFSISGGTDVVSAFVGPSPVVPVYEGELQARALGVDIQAWDDAGQSIVDEVGEMVITQPMPSMPLFLWNDEDDERYRESYFSTYPGVWRQGDWIRFTDRGTAVILGRSDSTINRGGIRIGTAEIYSAVLALDEITDALVVDVPDADLFESRMYLFVVLRPGYRLEGLDHRVREKIRIDCSSRHVPDEIIAVDDLPRTLTGKLLEVPVKRILAGAAPSTAASRDAVANPAALDWFVRFAEERRTSGTPSATHS